MSRKRRADDADLDELSTATRPAFPTLKARIKHISQDVVTSQWTPLPESAQQHVRQLFQAVERPVLMRHRDQRRRAEVQVALAPVLRTLHRKLPRMAFPPTTKDAHFNYEHLLDQNRALEAQLTPTSHAIGLLQAEIQKEKSLLDVDRERLVALSENTAAEDGLRRRRAKDAHPLLRLSDGARVHDDAVGSDGLKEVNLNQVLALDVDEATLAPVLQKLQNHVDSIQANLGPVQGLSEAMRRTQATLDNRLYRQLDARQYARTLEK
ncbi:MAG: hypothetical protein M1838_002426 [Thelocarpon superellum]|nr:MAG: hypothetical protein M1838_002426 [Thelocarpon superellum]